MVGFLSALTAFLVAHLVPAMPAVRGRLVAALGRGGYLAAYSLLSLGLLAWVIVAARRAETVMLWDPAPWQWVVPFAAMPLAAFLLVAGLAEPNPLSVSLRSGSEPGPVTAITRHPVLWGFLIWACAHIPPNGRLVPVILFGTMALLSCVGFLLVDRRARARLGAERWAALSRRTSVVPFAALLAGRARRPALAPLARAAAVALVLVVWFVAQGHALLIGPDPLAGLPAFR
ncbi:NnrU family protein [Chelatococcus sp. SYSU_G07232]|uniref:NnrU family protein n=1 Tax=Chelatococcus albus TaxID=3047466 RepID=A0ABT7ADR3_9HYPH|nr:NnrU family protein [Chelatococcus sp. SYSU_G07232]MDJ1157518.1 NnrU family protein [Chelatococcus sp. SYSU_G07232]